MPGAVAGFQVGGVQVPANSTKDFTFPVVPLSLGQQVEIAPLAPLDVSWAGIVWTKWVSAVNTLTVRLANVTAAPITPVAQNFTLKGFPDPSL